MKLINVLILFLVCFIFLKQLEPNHCVAGNKHETKTVKELIGSNAHFMKFGNTEEEVFVRILEALINRNLLGIKSKDGKDLIIGRRGPQLKDEEYFALFGRHLEKDAVDQYQYKMEQALVDSVCAFYGIERDKLIKVKQNKHLISNKKREINKLFNECLEVMHEKFNREKIVNSVLKELIPTVQTYPQEEQLAPTLPEHLI